MKKQEIQKADIPARRKALAVALAGTIAGAALIAGFDHYREPLEHWLLADPESASGRMHEVFLLVAILLAAPLFGFAASIWKLATETMKHQRFPPPGLRAVRDTRVLHGHEAIRRARLLKTLSACLGACTAAIFLLLLQIASMM